VRSDIEADVRELTDLQCDVLRIVENVQRADLSDVEKGDAVYRLWESYPDEFPTIKSVAERISTPYRSVVNWNTASRKLSPHLREVTGSSNLTDYHIQFLLKYDHATQDKLADLIIKRSKTDNPLTSPKFRDFVKEYDKDTSQDLDSLADKSVSSRTQRRCGIPHLLRSSGIPELSDMHRNRCIVR